MLGPGVRIRRAIIPGWAWLLFAIVIQAADGIRDMVIIV